MSERNYSFFHHCLLTCRSLSEVPKTATLTKPKCGGAQAAVMGARPSCPPGATALLSRQWLRRYLLITVANLYEKY